MTGQGCGVGGPGSVGAAGWSLRICQCFAFMRGSAEAAMVAQLGLDLASDFKDVRMESSSADHGTGLVSGGLEIGSNLGGSVAGDGRDGGASGGALDVSSEFGDTGDGRRRGGMGPADFGSAGWLLVGGWLFYVFLVVVL